jgi:hypothetical protein
VSATAEATAETNGTGQEAIVGEPALELDGQLSFDVGGKAPTSCTVRLTGGKVSIDAGDIEKGKDLVLRVVVRINSIEFKDELDPKTRQVVACEKRAKGPIVDVGLLED